MGCRAARPRLATAVRLCGACFQSAAPTIPRLPPAQADLAAQWRTSRPSQYTCKIPRVPRWACSSAAVVAAARSPRAAQVNCWHAADTRQQLHSLTHGLQVQFRLKKSTKMGKVIKAYEQKRAMTGLRVGAAAPACTRRPARHAAGTREQPPSRQAATMMAGAGRRHSAGCCSMRCTRPRQPARTVPSACSSCSFTSTATASTKRTRRRR